MNNRELATVIWTVAFLGGMLLIRDVRKSVPGLFRQALQPKVVLPFAVLAAYSAGATYGAWFVGLWDPALTFATVLGGFSAFAFFFQAVTSNDVHVLRHGFFAAIRLTVFIGFFVNAVVFALPVELLFVPTVSVLTILSTFAGSKAEWAPAKRVADLCLSIVAVVLVIFIAHHVIRDYGAIDKLAQVRALALPIWLALAAIPPVFALKVWADYSDTLVRINFFVQDRAVSRRARRKLLRVLRFRPARLHQFTGLWSAELRSVSTDTEIDAVVDRFAASRKRVVGDADVLGGPAPGPWGVPLPKAACPVDSLPLADQSEMRQFVVRDVALADVQAWFERQMPAGKDWDGWRWLEADNQLDWPEPFSLRAWVDPSGSDDLGVTLQQERDGSVSILVNIEPHFDLSN